MVYFKNMNFATRKLVIGFLSVWLITVIILTWVLFKSTTPKELFMIHLSKAVEEVEALKFQNEELRIILRSITSRTFKLDSNNLKTVKDLELNLDFNKLINFMDTTNYRQPSKEFEETRRRIENGIKEMWYFMKAELIKLNATIATTAVEQKIPFILNDVHDRKITLLSDVSKLKNLDGLKSWREKESVELSNIMQKRLHYLQNPENCSAAKKLACNVHKSCGFGCQIHHVIYCFIVAYGTKRTFILQSEGWAEDGSWESLFLPLSKTCINESGSARSSWPMETQVIDLPIIDFVKPVPKYIPLALPQDLGDRIITFHSNPIAWWISQFLKYLFRLRDSVNKEFQEAEKIMEFRNPVVGIHVRRTDKIPFEAQFHEIEEYMEYVEEYFVQYEKKSNSVQTRRVYLATDDSNLLNESRRKYPHYKFYGDPLIADSASVGKRHSLQALKGFIFDIHMLSKCDYVVCTFSSQVCRLAYELMQNYHSDAGAYFHSLDDIYYYGGQSAHNQIALYNHTARTSDEIDMVAGDIVGIAGNHWNGYSQGLNRRTGNKGFFPSYKMVEKYNLVNFPLYLEVNIST